ncbi:MAG: adenylyl-sulfate kinase [Eubacterium sp.]|jgi:adenylylsulfate kinase-like enzyme|nr:adenylyl-sulfate kinase [Eubacterium sp.]
MEGRLFWVTGLSGAGKTTLGNMLYKYLKEKYPNTVIFDGDALRSAFGNDLGYSKEERFLCAMRYARLCKLLVDQGMYVICCTISMFDQVRGWNRSNIANYVEVYIEVPVAVLEERNQKNLYQGLKTGAAKDVVGVDLELELPKEPDVRLLNDGKKTVEEMFHILLNEMGIKGWHM